MTLKNSWIRDDGTHDVSKIGLCYIDNLIVNKLKLLTYQTDQLVFQHISCPTNGFQSTINKEQFDFHGNTLTRENKLPNQ